MKFKYFFLLAGIILIAFLAFLIYPSSPKDEDITSFKECEAKGYEIRPGERQECVTLSGKIFVEDAQVPPTQTTTTPNDNLDDGVSDMIHVTSPQANDIIKSPFTLKGEARGNWYFEASFPVNVIDSNGVVLAQTPIQAKGEWMTTNFVPFEQMVTFQAPTAATGFVIFKKDNPSGLKENEREIKIPVQFENVVQPKNMKVSVYFGNSKKLQAGKDECTSVFSLERTVPFTVASARVALEELLKGPTVSEKLDGYYSSINSGVKIQSLKIEDGVARVDFNKKIEESVGGSCRVTAIRTEITQTLKQFPTVESVVISVDGRTEDILQP